MIRKKEQHKATKTVDSDFLEPYISIELFMTSLIMITLLGDNIITNKNDKEKNSHTNTYKKDVTQYTRIMLTHPETTCYVPVRLS